MLKLNVSYSKKLPVPDRDYASESCFAAVEVELPDGLTGEQLQERMHLQFALVRASVERELQGPTAGPGPLALPAPPVSPATPPVAPPHASTAVPAPGRSPRPTPSRRGGSHLSDKQLGFIQDLGTRLQLDTRQLAQTVRDEFGVDSVAALSREQASRCIDTLTARVTERRAT